MTYYKKISDKTRKQIYERDNYKCFYCGEDIVLTKDIKGGDYRKEAGLDHIIPRSKGGSDDISNLRTACRSCNGKKKDITDEDELAYKFDGGDRGYTMVPNNILDTLSSQKLAGREYMIVLFIARKTYGFRKSEDWISLVQLARHTGLRLQHISIIIKQLIGRKILTKNGKYVQINKYTHQWEYLPKKVRLPKMVQKVTKIGSSYLPKTVNTKETITKEIIQKKVSKDTRRTQPEIDELMEYLNSRLNSMIDGTVKSNRQYCWNLLRKIKKAKPDVDAVQTIKLLIDAGLQDSFHSKNLTSFKYLFYNAQRIIASYKGKTKINSFLQV